MLECFFSMYKDLVVGDLEHAWYFNCGRCSTPLYLLDKSHFLGIFGLMGLGHGAPM